MVSGRVTSRRLTQAYLARIAAIDLGPVKVNSIRAITGDALAQADAADAARAAGGSGPLLGVPLLLKDNIGTTDAPTTAGSIALEGNIPKREATLTSDLRAAGAVVLGKTNLSEFANWVSLSMPNGYSSLGGQVVAPYDQGDPSGSSSGSGAGGTLAFAAGTFGSETSGSILSPSAVNSMVGVKPTVGLVSRTGVVPLAHSFDTAGPITRTVTDAAVLLSTVNAPDSTDSVTLEAAGRPTATVDYLPALRTDALQGKRVGYSTGDVSGASGPVFQRALDDLTARGATLVPTDDLANTAGLSLTELAGITPEFKSGINTYLSTEAGAGRPALATNDLTGIIAYNSQHTDKVKYGQDLLLASDSTNDLTPSDPSSLVTITNARTSIDTAFSNSRLDAYVGPDATYAGIGAAAGYPSVDVPVGYTGTAGQTPVGIQILGKPWTEPALLGLAYDYEQATHRRVPATVADPALVSAACPAAAPGAAVPEAPLAALLPVTAIGITTLVVRRRRRTITG